MQIAAVGSRGTRLIASAILFLRVAAPADCVAHPWTDVRHECICCTRARRSSGQSLRQSGPLHPARCDREGRCQARSHEPFAGNDTAAGVRQSVGVLPILSPSQPWLV